LLSPQKFLFVYSPVIINILVGQIEGLGVGQMKLVFLLSPLEIVAVSVSKIMRAVVTDNRPPHAPGNLHFQLNHKVYYHPFLRVVIVAFAGSLAEPDKVFFLGQPLVLPLCQIRA
jgi:hypothetical protein